MTAMYFFKVCRSIFNSNFQIGGNLTRRKFSQRQIFKNPYARYNEAHDRFNRSKTTLIYYRKTKFVVIL